MDSKKSDFDKLYKAMHMQQTEEIEPSKDIKVRLDQAFKAQKRKVSFFQLRVPVYQSVAAAIIFFLIGFGISFMRPAQTKIVHGTAQVIKYVDKPIKQIQYIEVPVPVIEKQKESANQDKQAVLIDTINENTSKKEETNSDFSRRHEIAMIDIKQVLNENNGVSMGSDSALQKMMTAMVLLNQICFLQ